MQQPPAAHSAHPGCKHMHKGGADSGTRLLYGALTPGWSATECACTPGLRVRMHGSRVQDFKYQADTPGENSSLGMQAMRNTVWAPL